MIASAGFFLIQAGGDYRCQRFRLPQSAPVRRAQDHCQRNHKSPLSGFSSLLLGSKSRGQLQALTPGADDFLEDLTQGAGDSPVWEMVLYFPQIAVVTNMVADPVLFHIGVALWDPGKLLNESERFDD